MFGVTILGNNSAIPAYNRHPTAQIITLNDEQFLIDCGEGTQMQMALYRIRRSKINHIFISHLHGDHYFGLPGLITSYGLLSREQDLHVYAPAPLKEILEMQLAVADSKLSFALHIHTIEKEGILVETDKFSVQCFPVFHRIACWGFIIREKSKPRKIDAAKAMEYEIPTSYFEKLKNGFDYENKHGQIIKNEWVTMAHKPCRSYAYASDTIYTESIAEKVKNVSLLYHETTYLKALEAKAASRFHSTTVQAANIAKLAVAKRLLIGHFSSKYDSLDEFIAEAREVFIDTDLALEGVSYLIK